MQAAQHKKLSPLLEATIPVPAHPRAGDLVQALAGGWHHPSWSVQLVARTRDWSTDRMWLEWIDSPLRFRVFFGPNFASDGRLSGDGRIDWSNGTTWYKDSPLYARESRVYSQQGEDGVLLALIAALGIEAPSALEFGVNDGRECNTRILRGRGGRIVSWDRDFHDPSIGLHREHVSLENLPELIARHQIPRELDVLSIDVDYYDFYFWWRISRHVAPKIVVIEYNASFPPNEDRTVLYDGPDKHWDGSRYHGASLLALNRLAKSIGYVLVYCESRGVNAFFVRSDQVELLGALAPRAGDVAAIYRPASFGPGGHPQDPHHRAYTTAAALLSPATPFWER